MKRSEFCKYALLVTTHLESCQTKLPGLIMGETTRTSIRTHVTLNKACRNSSQCCGGKSFAAVCWKSASVVKLLFESGGTSSLHSLVVTGEFAALF